MHLDPSHLKMLNMLLFVFSCFRYIFADFEAGKRRSIRCHCTTTIGESDGGL